MIPAKENARHERLKILEVKAPPRKSKLNKTQDLTSQGFDLNVQITMFQMF